MNDFFWNTITALAITNWLIYVLKILPRIRKVRSIYLKDWGFGSGVYNVLFEYKQVCTENNESLFWYKAQWYCFIAFLLSCFISICFLGVT